tara:strand:+ start:179 stop:448 length:270 start_codon:yes stop_codon:yes gene_type:complete
MNINQLIGELLGTMALVLSILYSKGNAFVIGGTLAAGILVLGGLCPTHFNPAVSIAMFAKGKISGNQLLPFIVAQAAGALIALEIFKRV